MAQSVLIRSNGAQLVSEDELAEYKAPPPSGRWYPLSHSTVYARVKETLHEAGYEVTNQQLAVARDAKRFFGTIDLASPLAEGVTLSVGVRNSVDQSLPLGFVAGSKVLVCENLAFSAELLVRRKHTRFGEQRFGQDIAEAVSKLGGYREVEQARIARMQSVTMSDQTAESYLLRFFERGIIPARYLARTIEEWRMPTYEQFKKRSFFSFLNCITTVLGETQQGDPQKYVLRTMRLTAMLCQDPLLN